MKGKAYAAVSCRLMMPAAVPGVIRTLQLLYGRPELIIHNLMTKIRSEPSPRIENLQSIIDYALSVQNLHAVMEASKLHQHTQNPMLLQELVAKQPAQKSMNWGMYSISADLSHFSAWLYQMAEAASMVSIGTSSTESSGDRKSTKAKGHLNAHVEIDREADTDTDILPIMEQLSRTERWNKVKSEGLCRRCFGKHHSTRCKITTACGKNGCEIKHHRLLHNDEQHKKTLEKNNSIENRSSGNCNAHQQETTVNCILFRIVPVTLFGKTKPINTFAFLDEGSFRTMDEESIANDLELEGTPERLCLKWTADTTLEEENSRRVSLGIAGQLPNSHRYNINDARTVSKLNLPIQTMDLGAMVSKCPHLQKNSIR